MGASWWRAILPRDVDDVAVRSRGAVDAPAVARHQPPIRRRPHDDAGRLVALDYEECPQRRAVAMLDRAVVEPAARVGPELRVGRDRLAARLRPLGALLR